MIKLADGDRQGGGLVNASGQLVTIRANDQAFRKLKEVRVCVMFLGEARLDGIG